MEISNVLLGLITGVPVMIMVGPIALLLVEQGLRRGVRGGYPAALGVASADLLYSSVAAVAGVAVAGLLRPFEAWLSVGAVLMLCFIGLKVGISAMQDVRQLSAEQASTGEAQLLGAGGAGSTVVAGPKAGLALAGGFFGITAINPLTIVIFATIVMSGTQGVGTMGWVIGMVVASLIVNMTFVTVGHTLGAVMDEVAVARVRLMAAGLIGALALHMALG